jgi:outer membrane protein OmpA-like peptidoglycan-associated protein
MSGLFRKKSNEEGQWISISDLMSVLMMVFLFIAVSYMLNAGADREQAEKARKIAQEQKERMERVAKTYNQVQRQLYEELSTKFQDSLKVWDAYIDPKTLTFGFRDQTILFDEGSSAVKPRFKAILNSFFPQFISILSSTRYRDYVEEIRVEGHTSTEWMGSSTVADAYFKNLELSQDRTRQVVQYVLGLRGIQGNISWVRYRLTANGLSSSKTIQSNGVEDKERSRRVEFRVRTNAEEQIEQILNLNEDGAS